MTNCNFLSLATQHSHNDVAIVQLRFWNFTISKSHLKEFWHNVVRGSPINETGSIIVYKPAGNTFSILHMDTEVLLPVSEEEMKRKTWWGVWYAKRNALCTLHALCVCVFELYEACAPGHVECLSLHIHGGIQVLLEITWTEVCHLKLNPVVELTWNKTAYIISVNKILFL